MNFSKLLKPCSKHQEILPIKRATKKRGPNFGTTASLILFRLKRNDFERTATLNEENFKKPQKSMAIRVQEENEKLDQKSRPS